MSEPSELTPETESVPASRDNTDTSAVMAGCAVRRPTRTVTRAGQVPRLIKQDKNRKN